MKILLDTCTFLWITTDSQGLSVKARELFQDTNNPAYLSSVSIWEIIVKNRLGKLPLPNKPETFIYEQCEKHGIEFLPLTEKAVFQLADLPDHHRDPFDKMLVCQAIAYELSILTSDKLIIMYPVSTIW